MNRTNRVLALAPALSLAALGLATLTACSSAAAGGGAAGGGPSGTSSANQVSVSGVTLHVGGDAVQGALRVRLGAGDRQEGGPHARPATGHTLAQTLSLTGATIHHHTSRLRAAGLLTSTRAANRVYHTSRPQLLDRLFQAAILALTAPAQHTDNQPAGRSTSPRPGFRNRLDRHPGSQTRRRA